MSAATLPRWAKVLLVLALVILPVLALVVLNLSSGSRAGGGAGDTSDRGHSAIAQLLRDEGIRVDDQQRYDSLRARTDARTTVVVSNSTTLSRRIWQAIVAVRPARIVVIGPVSGLENRLRLPVRATQTASPGVTDPVCDDPIATRAGAITVPGSAMGWQGGEGTSCYPSPAGGHLVVEFSVDGVPVTFMPRVSTNELLAAQGNASLAMQLLGRDPTTVWYHPDSSDSSLPPIGGTSSDDGPTWPTLLPAGWPHAVVLGCLAVVVVAIWRGRRLGPVLTEELPSVVPAAETVEGHGRLYERLRARDTAAAHLRRSTINRLSRLMGRADDTEVLAQALAERTSRPYDEIRRALAGPIPTTDEELVTMKHTLDALEKEARRP